MVALGILLFLKSVQTIRPPDRDLLSVLLALDIPTPPPFTMNADKIGDLTIIPRDDLWLLPHEQVCQG